MPEGELQSAYWEWRKAGMEFKEPIRYPVGFNARHHCAYAVWPTNFNPNRLDDPKKDWLNDSYVEMDNLSYIEARQKIYCPVYMYLAKQTEDFQVLTNLLDVDGPKLFKDHTGKAAPPYELMIEGVYGESGVDYILSIGKVKYFFYYYT